MDWPAVSLDLYLIEQCLDFVGRLIREREKNAQTLPGKAQLLTKEWEAMPKVTVRKYDSATQ